MTGQVIETFKEFNCVEDGLTFSVRVYKLPDGSYEAKVTVLEGSADFNAVYFGDGVDDGSSVDLKGNLNMSGKGSVDHQGNAVDWDNAVVLSKPGLGSAGADKDTYLSAGESFTFPLDVSSLDEIQEIGIRATSTSTPEGSIKCVLEPNEDDLADDDVVVDDVEQPVDQNEDDAPPDDEAPLEDLSGEDFLEIFTAAAGPVEEDLPPEEDEGSDSEPSIFL